MKKYILLTLLIVLSSFFKAQSQLPDFAPINGKWSYLISDFQGDYTVHYQVKKDTFFLGKPCKQVIGNEMFFLREEPAGTIFYAYPSSIHWMQCYDITKNIGDTIVTELINHSKPATHIDTLLLKVIAKKDTLINGKNLPYIHTKQIQKKRNNSYGNRLIYPIGNMNQDLLPYDYSDPSPSGLLCYEDVKLGKVMNASTCDSNYHVVGIADLSSEQVKWIVNNPFDNTLEITTSTTGLDEQTLQVVIFSVFGQEIYKQTGLNAIITTNWQRGMYWLVVEKNNKRIMIKQLIKS